MLDRNTRLIADDDCYRVEIHQSTSLMYVLWKCHLEGDALREKYLALLQMANTQKPNCWLGNARAMYYTTLQDAKWIFEYFLPILIKSSIKKYARLESPQSLLILDSLHLQDKINDLAQQTTGELEFQFFTDEELAMDWLSS